MLLGRSVAGLTGHITVITAGFDVMLLFMAAGTNLGACILNVFGCLTLRGERFL